MDLGGQGEQYSSSPVGRRWEPPGLEAFPMNLRGLSCLLTSTGPGLGGREGGQRWEARSDARALLGQWWVKVSSMGSWRVC